MLLKIDKLSKSSLGSPKKISSIELSSEGVYYPQIAAVCKGVYNLLDLAH